ncbi:hypothetical protein MUK42_34257, partial [Musa troglodytarum]
LAWVYKYRARPNPARSSSSLRLLAESLKPIRSPRFRPNSPLFFRISPLAVTRAFSRLVSCRKGSRSTEAWEKKAEDLRSLLTQLRPFFSLIPKAKPQK